MADRRRDTRRPDKYGFDENRSYLSAALGRFVPQALARRGLAIDVTTDRERYAPGDPVELTVTITNRLPVPVEVVTPQPRLWGWTVDGLLEASDESRFESDRPGTLDFRPSERKVIEHTWNGRFKEVGRRTRWTRPDPGEYELSVYVATEDRRPRATTTIRFG